MMPSWVVASGVEGLGPARHTEDRHERAASRPVLDGEPYQGSLADFLAEEAAILGHPEVIFCHYDPLAPPLIGATDITAAETRLKELPGQGYRRLEYGAPTTVLPKRS